MVKFRKGFGWFFSGALSGHQSADCSFVGPRNNGWNENGCFHIFANICAKIVFRRNHLQICTKITKILRNILPSNCLQNNQMLTFLMFFTKKAKLVITIMWKSEQDLQFFQDFCEDFTVQLYIFAKIWTIFATIVISRCFPQKRHWWASLIRTNGALVSMVSVVWTDCFNKCSAPCGKGDGAIIIPFLNITLINKVLS